MEIIIGIGIIYIIYRLFLYEKDKKNNQSKIDNINNSPADDLKLMDEHLYFINKSNELMQEMNDAKLDGTIDQKVNYFKKKSEELREGQRLLHNKSNNTNLTKEEYNQYVKDNA